MLPFELLPTISAPSASDGRSKATLSSAGTKEGGGSEGNMGGADSGGGGGKSGGKTIASADSDSALPLFILEAWKTPFDCDFIALSIPFEGTLVFLLGLSRVRCVNFGDSPADNSSSMDARCRLVGGSTSPELVCTRPVAERSCCIGGGPGWVYMVLLELSIFCKAENFFELDWDSSCCKSSSVSAEGMGLLGSGGGVSPSTSSAIFRTYVNTYWRSRDSCA